MLCKAGGVDFSDEVLLFDKISFNLGAFGVPSQFGGGLLNFSRESDEIAGKGSSTNSGTVPWPIDVTTLSETEICLSTFLR